MERNYNNRSRRYAESSNSKKKKRKSSLCRCKQLKAYKCNSRGKQRSRASKNGTGTTAAAGNNLVKCHLFPVLANSGRKHARSISANGWKIPRRDPNPRELSSLSLARGGSFQRISRRFIGRTSPGNNFRWWRDMWRARRRLSRHAAVISIRWPLYGRDIFPPFLSPPPPLPTSEAVISPFSLFLRFPLIRWGTTDK